MTYPGHAPDFLPVDGQGFERWNAPLAAGSRLIRPFESRATLVAFREELLDGAECEAFALPAWWLEE